MNSLDRQYLDLVKHVLKNGNQKTDRTGTGTISVFDYTMRFDMSEGFPLITSKKMFTKGIIHELIWFLNGSTNIKYLVDNDVHIWDGDCYKSFCEERLAIRDFQPWEETISKEEFVNRIKTEAGFAEKWGELGKVYGHLWCNWNGKSDYELYENYLKKMESTFSKDEFLQKLKTDKEFNEKFGTKGIDQIANLITDLKNNPDSRRLMVTAWNPAELNDCVLPPCHYAFQCYTTEMNTFERKRYWCESIKKHISYAEEFGEAELDTLKVPKRRLSLKWSQRSVDCFLGLPFNITSYGLLLHLLAREVNMVPNELIFSGGDVHLYSNHIDQANEQLTRQTFKLPKIILNNEIGNNLKDLKYDDFKISDYLSDKILKATLSN